MKRELIPAVLAKSAKEALQKIRNVETVASWVQLDVMDGKFVPNKTWYDAATVQRWKIKPKIELHLMVENPERVIRAWRTVKKFRRAIWHVEAPVDHDRLIAQCKKNKLEVGLAISPKTSVATLVPFLRKLDTVLILGVTPGWSGQKLKRSSLQKADKLHRLTPKLPLAFDGGITSRNMAAIAKHGVTRFCMASAIFKQTNPATFIKKMEQKLKLR